MAEINVAGRRYPVSPVDGDDYVYTQHEFRDKNLAIRLVCELSGWESVTPMIERVGKKTRVSLIGHGGYPNYERVAQISSLCTKRVFQKSA
jgi:hypothetical protein